AGEAGGGFFELREAQGVGGGAGGGGSRAGPGRLPAFAASAVFCGFGGRPVESAGTEDRRLFGRERGAHAPVFGENGGGYVCRGGRRRRLGRRRFGCDASGVSRDGQVWRPAGLRGREGGARSVRPGPVDRRREFRSGGGRWRRRGMGSHETPIARENRAPRGAQPARDPIDRNRSTLTARGPAATSRSEAV